MFAQFKFWVINQLFHVHQWETISTERRRVFEFDGDTRPIRSFDAILQRCPCGNHRSYTHNIS